MPIGCLPHSNQIAVCLSPEHCRIAAPPAPNQQLPKDLVVTFSLQLLHIALYWVACILSPAKRLIYTCLLCCDLGLPWATLGYSGLSTGTAGYPGLPWATVGYLGVPCANLGYLGRN